MHELTNQERAAVVIDGIIIAFASYTLLSATNWLSLLLALTYAISIGAIVTVQRRSYVVATYVLNGLLVLLGLAMMLVMGIWRSDQPLAMFAIGSAVIAMLLIGPPWLNIYVVRQKYAHANGRSGK